MKLFIVKATFEVDWDEYRAFVIRAEDRDAALRVMRKEIGAYHFGKRGGQYKFRELTVDGPEALICYDFNAG